MLPFRHQLSLSHPRPPLRAYEAGLLLLSVSGTAVQRGQETWTRRQVRPPPGRGAIFTEPCQPSGHTEQPVGLQEPRTLASWLLGLRVELTEAPLPGAGSVMEEAGSDAQLHRCTAPAGGTGSLSSRPVH